MNIRARFVSRCCLLLRHLSPTTRKPAFRPTFVSSAIFQPSIGRTVFSTEDVAPSPHVRVGVAQIPHPDKAYKGGEDDYFISEDMETFGVADGVGGWADSGVDPKLYAASLMQNAKAAVNIKGMKDPKKILIYAARSVDPAILGSSTACIVHIAEGTRLTSANLGDSGFMVVRESTVIFQSEEQVHGWNFPYQLGTNGDPPQQAQKKDVELQARDIVILYSDGMSDNLYPESIVQVINDFPENTPMREEVLASEIAEEAFKVANDPLAENTPFSESGIFAGGKLDDITVLVAIVQDVDEQL